MEDANSAAIGHDDDRLSEAKRGHFAILRARDQSNSNSSSLTAERVSKGRERVGRVAWSCNASTRACAGTGSG